MTSDIRTTYMGLELASPVVASSSELTNKLDNLKKLEEAGADALELNIFLQPSDFQAESAGEYEKIYFDIIGMVLEQVSIPVSVKVSYYFTLLARTLQALSKSGIKGLVLFNRFFDPDYDVENLKIVPTNVLSTPADLARSLKWIAIMSGRVDCDLAASTGVHDGDGVIKQLLAGAQVIQVASTLYRNGLGVVSELKKRLVSWMQEREYESLDDFRGMLSRESIKNPAAYDRVQFVKNFRSMR